MVIVCCAATACIMCKRWGRGDHLRVCKDHLSRYFGALRVDVLMA